MRPGRRAVAAAVAALAGGVLAGCGGDEEQTDRSAPTPPSDTRTEGTGTAQASDLEAVPCPAGLAGCRSASGTILYVERVDPDGDGDAHFVLASADGLTAPGITVVDVRRDLRPDPLPGPGDRISAAGPVHSGSYGQRQIEAVAIRTAYTAPP